MAKNFKMITSQQAKREVDIQLLGDFDGTSAHELANMLTDLGESVSKVDIDTDGLKSIHPFGLKVFCTKLKRLRQTSTRILFSGTFQNNFIEE